MKINLEQEKIVDDPIIFHLVVTAKCQGKCKGCINTLGKKDRKKLLYLWESNPYRDSKVILELIKSLKIKNGKSIYVAFYGGEPLLELDKILSVKRILDSYYNFNYIIYTNGLLLKNLIKFKQELSNFKFIIVSIDGREEQHNMVRPKIEYKKIYHNLKYFRKKFNKTSIIMWSTLREGQRFRDCVKAFLELYKEGLVNYFFWHFLETEDPFIDFKRFFQMYKSDLKSLLELYIHYLRVGEVLPILPLNELIYFNIVQKKRKTTACKVELMENFDIVNGKVMPCIDLPVNFYIAEFDEKDNLTFKNKKLIKAFLNNLMEYKRILNCFNCEAHYYCGGRCPVQAISSLERTKNYCELTKLFAREVESRLDKIEPIIKQICSLENFYLRFVFPVYFTDVVP